MLYQVEFLPSDTNFGAFIQKSLLFSTTDSPQRIFIVFGLKQQDLSECHHSDSLCFGKTVYDDQFRMGEAEQQAVLVSSACVKTKLHCLPKFLHVILVVSVR